MIWTDERVERLRQLWSEGFSASQVARQLGGVTRNSIIGKVTRLGLPGRKTESRLGNRSKKWCKPKPTPAKPMSPARALKADGLPLPPPSETDIARVATVDLEKHHCRWPCVLDVREVSPYQPIFCGAEKVAGTSYCRAHLLRSANTSNPLRSISVHPRRLQVA